MTILASESAGPLTIAPGTGRHSGRMLALLRLDLAHQLELQLAVRCLEELHRLVVADPLEGEVVHLRTHVRSNSSKYSVVHKY